MPKIGIDARMYGKEQTGIGGYVEALVNNISGLDKKNKYKLFLRSPYFSSYDCRHENFSKVRTDSRWYSWSEQALFPGRLLKQNCDLIHFTHFSHPILYPKRFVVTIHDLTPLYYPGKDTPLFRKWAYRIVVSSACRRSERIIAPSGYTKQDLIDNFGVREDKIKVVHEGIKYENELGNILKKDSSKKEKAYERLSGKYEDLNQEFIFYTGVWRYHKNIEGLLKGFKLLSKKEKNTQLVLGGGRKGKDITRIKNKISELGLEEKVFLPGFLSEEDLKLFYRAASVFVLPSFYEGFGLVALEALSQGTPVCCSNAGPLPEILKEAALYFNPEEPSEIADKVETILKNDKIAFSLLRKANSRLSDFSWEKTARETLGVYRECLKRG